MKYFHSATLSFIFPAICSWKVQKEYQKNEEVLTSKVFFRWVSVIFIALKKENKEILDWVYQGIEDFGFSQAFLQNFFWFWFLPTYVQSPHTIPLPTSISASWPEISFPSSFYCEQLSDNPYLYSSTGLNMLTDWRYLA